MPYNGSGSFAVVNTFISGTTILASPMNQNFVDIATNGLSNALTRDGQAGMTAALKLIAGAVGTPSLTFTGDATTGLYLPSAGLLGLAAAGVLFLEGSLNAAILPIAITESGAISPTSLSTDQNNYAPTNLDTASCLLLTSSANVNITGLAGLVSGPTAPVSGRTMKIFNDNASGGKNIILNNQNTSSTAANRFYMGGDLTLVPGQGCELRYSGADSRWMLVGSFSFTGTIFSIPQFRLTLVTATPVLTTDTTAITTVFYTPYNGGYLTTWDGSVWTGSVQTEVSQTLADTTKSPTAAAASSNYDMFYWLDAGTFRCTRGPAWTSATARGTGAATTELIQVNGVWMNKIAITNGPAAQRGVYVGTISTNATGANGQLNMMFAPAAAAGGGNNILAVWNMYNRTNVISVSRDSTDSWTYTTATWRSANGNNNNRITFIVGLNEDGLQATYSVGGTNGGAAQISCGIGLDATNAFATGCSPGQLRATGTDSGLHSNYVGFPGLGLHFIQAIEYSVASSTSTWFGDNGTPTVEQMALMMNWRM